MIDSDLGFDITDYELDYGFDDFRDKRYHGR